MANTALAVAEKRYGICPQATFGTGAGAASAFSQLQVEHFSVVDDLRQTDIPMAHGVRYKILDNLLVNTAEAMPTFSFTMPRATGDSLDRLLYGWFQKVTEAVGTPYGKTYTLPVTAETQQPDFSASAGFFFSFVERHPVVAQSRVIDDCIISNLTLSAEPSGWISAAVEAVGRGGMNTIAPAGTWTLDSAPGWHYSQICKHTINFNDGAGAQTFAMRGAWEISLNQTVVPTDFKTVTLRGGDAPSFGNYGLVDRGGTFTLRCQTDALTMTALTNARAGTQIDVSMKWSSSATGAIGGFDDDLQFDFSGKLTAPPTIEGDDIQTTVLSGELVGDDASTAPLVIVMANAVDRAW